MDDDSGGTSDMLVVDDNPGDIRFIEEALESSQLGPTVHTANTRDGALDVVHQRGDHEDAPDLNVVLLDWNLSQTTGREVLEAVNSHRSQTPVVVMTGAKSEIASVKSAVSQADSYIEKPTTPDGYVDALRPFLSDR